MKNNPDLTEKDHKNMDNFLGHVLDEYKAGNIERTDAVSSLAHVMAALEIDNLSEARQWFEEGPKLLERVKSWPRGEG